MSKNAGLSSAFGFAISVCWESLGWCVWAEGWGGTW